jgi:hypothetical protein
MSPRSVRRHAAAALAGAVALSSLGLAGCGVVTAVQKIAHNAASAKGTVDDFAATLATGAAKPFAATYVTSGSSPATIEYAVQPPDGLAFRNTAKGGGVTLYLVANSTGEYSCTPPGSGSRPRWVCQKLGKASATVQNKLLDFYTPAHWVAFLKGFALAAGLAGAKVTSSHLTVNGFALNCVDFRAPGVSGKSTICSTAQGILGYVKIAGESTSFQIKSYTNSPPAALFRLPHGAKVLKSGRKH